MSTTTTTPQASPALTELLSDELAYSPVIQERYSSHLAMSLAALDQLGASPGVLRATFDHSTRGHVEPRQDRPALTDRMAEVDRDGIAPTVRQRVDALATSPASQLFHPLIRLAYGLEAGHAGQVAAALLDWEQRHHVFPVPSPHLGARRLADVAADLAERAGGRWRQTYDFDAVARRPEVGGALAGIALDELSLDDISTFAIAAHVSADDFITLHMVTGARALRVVSGWVEPATARRLAEHALAAMTVAYAAVGAPSLVTPPELDAVRRLPLPDREAIATRACADRDPHVIKLANVALVEEERTADPLYRYAAARVVGLIPPGPPRLEQ